MSGFHRVVDVDSAIFLSHDTHIGTYNKFVYNINTIPLHITMIFINLLQTEEGYLCPFDIKIF